MDHLYSVYNKKVLCSIILTALVYLSACGKGHGGKIPSTEITYSEKDIIPGGTLVVGLTGEPDALNPLTALTKPAEDIISLVFRRLADFNEDLVGFSPQMAKNWEFSKDSTAITFHLRTDILWHDSTAFTAHDVAFTYRLQTNPEVAWSGISYKKNIRIVETPNDSTVIMWFSRKTPTMLMDAVEGYIVPKHLLNKINPKNIHESEFNRNPVGTGPFRFKKWKSQQTIVLEKFVGYYKQGKPHLDGITFKVVPDDVNLWHQVKSGDVDFMEGVPPRNFTTLKADWDAGRTAIRPIRYLGRQYDFIGWNRIDPDNYAKVMAQAGGEKPDMDHLLKPNKFFGSQKVRAALTMAIDRAALTKVVNHGLGIQMDGPISPILWAYDSQANTVWPYNPNLAKQYLKEEGWVDLDGDGIRDKNGEKFSFEMVTNSGNERRVQALTIIQEELKGIGVEMTPRVVEPGLLFGRLLPTKDFDAALIGWNVGLKVELTPLFHSATLLTPFNFTSFTSPEFDGWEAVAKQSLNRKTAQRYWNKIAKHLSTDLPYTWLYYKVEALALHNRFKGAIFDKRGAYTNVENWWIPREEWNEVDKRGHRAS